MTECNHDAFSLSNCRKRRVRASFSGVSISSNGGALLLREVDRRMGLTGGVARSPGDRRQRGKVCHEVLTMVRQRVHAVALGYEDLNDNDALRDDPVVQTACERTESLARSSTLCRFEQRAERQWAIAIQPQLVELDTVRVARPVRRAGRRIPSLERRQGAPLQPSLMRPFVPPVAPCGSSSRIAEDLPGTPATQQTLGLTIHRSIPARFTSCLYDLTTNRIQLESLLWPKNAVREKSMKKLLFALAAVLISFTTATTISEAACEDDVECQQPND